MNLDSTTRPRALYLPASSKIPDEPPIAVTSPADPVTQMRQLQNSDLLTPPTDLFFTPINMFGAERAPMSGYEESGPKVESWEGGSMGKQLSHQKEDC